MSKQYNATLQAYNAQLQALIETANNLPEAGTGSVELPELTNEGSAADLLIGKELIDSDGNIVTGTVPNNGQINLTIDGINVKSMTIPNGYTTGGSVSLDSTIDDEVSEQSNLINQIRNVVDSLPEAGGGSSGDSSLTNYIQNGINGQYTNNDAVKISQGAFAFCSNITTAIFP